VFQYKPSGSSEDTGLDFSAPAADDEDSTGPAAAAAEVAVALTVNPSVNHEEYFSV